MPLFSNYLRDDRGASAAEYALILGFVAIGIIGGLTLLGTTINSALRSDANLITAPSS